MPDYRLGMNAVLLYGAEGAAVGAMAAITNVKDLTASQTKAEADVTTRANSGWRATAGTLKDQTLTWETVWKESDAAFVAIRDAFLNNTVLGMASLTGAVGVAGSEGVVADYEILGFDKSEPLEGAITVSVTVKLSSYRSYYSV